MKLIAGMHRSGSSVLAKLLSASGADFGDEHTMYPADRWNPDGYYEQREILGINLRLVNGKWGKLSYAFLPGNRTLLARSIPMAKELKKAIATYNDKTVKENRFCLTLNTWIHHGLEVEKAIVCLRHPADVADSLWRRNRLPAWWGYRIWLEHNQRLLRTLTVHEIPFLIASHEDLVQAGGRGASALQEWMRFFELDSTPGQVQALFDRYVRTKAPREHSKTLPLSVVGLYEEMLNRSIQ